MRFVYITLSRRGATIRSVTTRVGAYSVSNGVRTTESTRAESLYLMGGTEATSSQPRARAGSAMRLFHHHHVSRAEAEGGGGALVPAEEFPVEADAHGRLVAGLVAQHEEAVVTRVVREAARLGHRLQESRARRELLVARVAHLAQHGDLHRLGLVHHDGDDGVGHQILEPLLHGAGERGRRLARGVHVVEQWQADAAVIAHAQARRGDLPLVPHVDGDDVAAADEVVVVLRCLGFAIVIHPDETAGPVAPGGEQQRGQGDPREGKGLHAARSSWGACGEALVAGLRRSFTRRTSARTSSRRTAPVARMSVR